MTTQKRMARKPLADDRAAVSDVLGALMMVGITVIAAAGFGLLLFSFKGPTDVQHTRLTASVTAGDGDWGDGDELLRLSHVGGEALDVSEVVIVFTTTAGTSTLSEDDLDDPGSAFADGKLTIGETWTWIISADKGDVVDVRIVVTGEQSQLLTSNSIVAGASATSLCLGDSTLPAVAFNQSPLLDSTASGDVTITATVSDLCSDVLDTPKPHLWSCLALLCDDVPADYTDLGEMSLIGAHQWSLNIAHSGSWLTEASNGLTLSYYITPISDSVGNSGDSVVQNDPVDLIATFTPVDTGYAIAPATLVDFANAAAVGQDGLLANLTEGAVNTPAGSGGPTAFSGTTATGSGALLPNNALTSNDQWSTLDSMNDYVEVNGFDLPAAAVSVTAVTIGFEGHSASAANARLDYRIGATEIQGTSQPIAVTNDAQYFQILCATTVACAALSPALTVANVEAMVVQVQRTDNRDILVDHIYATVTYTTAASTTYTMTAQFNWTVGPGTVQQAQLRYSTVGDTFTPQVWKFTAPAGWRDCAGGALSSAALTTYTCPLVVADEVSGGTAGGQVMMRFRDVATTGTTQGQLFIDYARMATA